MLGYLALVMMLSFNVFLASPVEGRSQHPRIYLDDDHLGEPVQRITKHKLPLVLHEGRDGGLQTDFQRQFHLQVQNERKQHQTQRRNRTLKHGSFPHTYRGYHHSKYFTHKPHLTEMQAGRKSERLRQRRAEQKIGRDEYMEYLQTDPLLQYIETPSSGTLERTKRPNYPPMEYFKKEYSTTKEFKMLDDISSDASEETSYTAAKALKKTQVPHFDLSSHNSVHRSNHKNHRNHKHHHQHHSKKHHSASHHPSSYLSKIKSFGRKAQSHSGDAIDIPELEGFVLVDYDEKEFKSFQSSVPNHQLKLPKTNILSSTHKPVSIIDDNFKVGIEKFQDFDLTVLDVPNLSSIIPRNEKQIYEQRPVHNQHLTKHHKNNLRVVKNISNKQHLRPLQVTTKNSSVKQKEKIISKHHITRRVGDSSSLDMNDALDGHMVAREKLQLVPKTKNEEVLLSKKFVKNHLKRNNKDAVKVISAKAFKKSRSRREEGKPNKIVIVMTF